MVLLKTWTTPWGWLILRLDPNVSLLSKATMVTYTTCPTAIRPKRWPRHRRTDPLSYGTSGIRKDTLKVPRKGLFEITWILNICISWNWYLPPFMLRSFKTWKWVEQRKIILMTDGLKKKCIQIIYSKEWEQYQLYHTKINPQSSSATANDFVTWKTAWKCF